MMLPLDDYQDRLRELCLESLPKRYPADSLPVARHRLDHELEVIRWSELANVFIIADRIARFAEGEQTFFRWVQPRCPSVVTYLLGLSEVDPLRFHLFMQNVLDPSRYHFPGFLFAVDPRRAEAVAGYVRSERFPDLVEKRFSPEQLGTASPTPYHVLDTFIKDSEFSANARFGFRLACRWEMTPFLVAAAVRKAGNPLFDLDKIALNDSRTFHMLHEGEGCDLGVDPPDDPAWNLHSHVFYEITSLDEIAYASCRSRSGDTLCEAVACGLTTYQLLYLSVHYPAELRAVLQEPWPWEPPRTAS